MKPTNLRKIRLHTLVCSPIVRNRIEDKLVEIEKNLGLNNWNCFTSESTFNDQLHRSKRNAHIKKHGSNCFLNNPFPQLYRENRRFAAGLLGQACSLFPFNKYANERVSGLFTCRGSNFPTRTRASDQCAAPFSFSAKVLRMGMPRG